MPYQDIFHQQIMAFHYAIIDNCNRAVAPGQTDSLALRFRQNALALARLQLAMLADRTSESEAPARRAEPESSQTDCGPALDEAEQPFEPHAEQQPDRVLTGDVLSRFVSRPLAPDESPHEVWHQLQESESARRQRNPALPRTGFRIPKG